MITCDKCKKREAKRMAFDLYEHMNEKPHPRVCFLVDLCDFCRQEIVGHLNQWFGDKVKIHSAKASEEL